MTDKKLNKISAPKGVPDYVPPNSAQFIAVRDTFAHHIRIAGYEHIELPIFEDTTLFARGVGESTDVVSKEMYTFTDRGGRSVTLRPEGTAGVMRAVIEHNLEVIKTADWVIDIGPEGGTGGGEVVATGTPEQIVKEKRSYTGQFLKELLERHPAGKQVAAE